MLVIVNVRVGIILVIYGIWLVGLMVVRRLVEGSSSSTLRVVGMIHAEERLAIIKVGVIRLSVLIWLVKIWLRSLESDFLLSQINLLSLIRWHKILNIVLRGTHFPLLSDRSLRHWREFLLAKEVNLTMIRIIIMTRWWHWGHLATRSYHVIEAIQLLRCWKVSLVIIIRSKRCLLSLFSDYLEQLFLIVIIISIFRNRWINSVIKMRLLPLNGIKCSSWWRNKFWADIDWTCPLRILVIVIVALLPIRIIDTEVISRREVGLTIVTVGSTFKLVALLDVVLTLRRTLELDLVPQSGVSTCEFINVHLLSLRFVLIYHTLTWFMWLIHSMTWSWHCSLCLLSLLVNHFWPKT